MNPNLRHKVLSDWLGFNTTETHEPSDLRKVFQKAFSKLGLSDRLQESTLLDAWPSLLGPSLSAHCRPGTVRKGKLTIYVDHPAWLHQITMAHQTDILKSVQSRFPHLKVQHLILRIGQ